MIPYEIFLASILTLLCVLYKIYTLSGGSKVAYGEAFTGNLFFFFLIILYFSTGFFWGKSINFNYSWLSYTVSGILGICFVLYFIGTGLKSVMGEVQNVTETEKKIEINNNSEFPLIGRCGTIVNKIASNVEDSGLSTYMGELDETDEPILVACDAPLNPDDKFTIVGTGGKWIIIEKK